MIVSLFYCNNVKVQYTQLDAKYQAPVAVDLDREKDGRAIVIKGTQLGVLVELDAVMYMYHRVECKIFAYNTFMYILHNVQCAISLKF